MDNLQQIIDKIIKITESEDIRYNITADLADYIVKIKEDSFNDGLDKMLESANETLNSIKN